jgi:hypothetical protein
VQTTLQLPPLHSGLAFCCEGQTTPQLPQFSRSSAGSTQPLEQAIAGLTHSTAQLPSMQTGRAFGAPGHTLPQAPQCAVSVSLSTQLPEHSSVPDGQVVPHAAPEQ